MRTDFYNYLKSIPEIAELYNQFEFELTKKEERKILYYIKKKKWDKIQSLIKKEPDHRS